MEKEIKIKTGDKFIYGTVSFASKKSDRLVIFVHGFTGHRNEHIFFNGSKYFNGKGYDAYRFDLYTGSKKARHFEETSISMHGKDVTTVIKHFKKKYKKIFVAGHSFGGTSLLFVDTSLVDVLCFWDASYVIPQKENKDYVYNKALGAYIIDWGMRYVIGKKFVKELLCFPDCGKLVSKIHAPVKFVVTKTNMKAGKRYLAKANQPKSFAVIPKADHNFNTQKAEQKLFAETLSWFEKY
jgi:pimeloyl-ACP methyl ester carboxylesterase